MVKLLFFGAGSGSDKILKIINTKTTKILGFVDNNETLQGSSKNGLPIIAPSQINQLDFDLIVIGSSYWEDIENDLLKSGISQKVIVNFNRYFWPMYGPQLKLMDFESNYLQYEVIITGLSYALHGVRSNFLKKQAFNFGMGGQDIYYDFSIVNHIFKAYPDNQIKYFLIVLCYYSFNYDYSQSSPKTEGFRYLNFSDLHNYPKDCIKKDYETFTIKDSNFKSIIDFSKLKALSPQYIYSDTDVNLTCLNNTYLEEQAKELILKETKKNFPLTVKENTDLLNSYLNFAITKEVQPIIAVLPTHKCYHRNYPFTMKESFYSIISNMQKNVSFQFLDYFDCDLFGDEDFIDVSHLNSRGAEKMTNILNRDIVW